MSSSQILPLAFLVINTIAAVNAPIQDCDEVFNYWEPTHYLNHGFGFQTWEYSPEYAIRSWLYISIHAVFNLFSIMINRTQGTQINGLIWTRMALGAACAYCELHLVQVVSKRIGARVAAILAIVMMSSTGMFYASVAYLPSTFSLYTSMMGLAAFLEPENGLGTQRGIAWFGLGAIVGWPFSAALILPLMVDELVYVRLTGQVQSTLQRIMAGTARVLPLIPLDVAVNAFFFRRFVFSPWRIISYNVFSESSKGPDIFGTEPWHFYMRNLLLNFNVWFLLALCAGPIVALQLLFRRPSGSKLTNFRTLVFTAPFYLWLLIFSLQPHKEERFMYPAYGFLCLNAALALHVLLFELGHADPNSLLGRIPSLLKSCIAVVGVLVTIAICVLRTAGTVTAYNAPLKIYGIFQDPEYLTAQGSLCLGKEWYRFPSSYFLPKGIRAQFIKSEFSGLLPGQFSRETGPLGLPIAGKIPPGMNDLNVEDPGKYVDIASCSYLVDSYFPGSETSPLEPSYVLDTHTWEQVSCEDFLDTSTTSLLARIFWIPDSDLIPSYFRRHWGRYCLLKRRTQQT